MFILHKKQIISKLPTLPAKPKIISLVPSITELLADLGLEEQVIGITRFCIHPSSWRSKTKVGGTKNPDAKKIIELEADLVLANKEENEESAILEISKSCPVLVTEVQTIQEALDMIRYIAEIAHRSAEGQRLRQEIVQHLQNAKDQFSGSVAYCIWKDPWMFAGNDTYIDSVLTYYGFNNILSKQDRYPTLSLEKLKELAPDYVFLSSEPFSFREKHQVELQEMLPKSKVVLVDGEVFSWYGSRMQLIGTYASTLQDLV